MIIKEIKKELEESTNPVMKSLHHNSHFRVLVAGYKKGMVMATHTAKWPSKLTVLEGSVTYHQGDNETILGPYEEHQIPVNIKHSVTANEDSLCLLTQSDNI